MAYTDFSRTDFSSVVPMFGGDEQLTEEEKKEKEVKKKAETIEES